MRIALIVEGDTERAFLPALRAFLETRLQGKMPKLDLVPYDGRVPMYEKLRREVERLLNDRRNPADAVIALTDVHTGGRDFMDAADAKAKMTQWVGSQPRFYPHAAQYEFEAWLLPYWDDLQQMAGHNLASPGPNPENINHQNPPSKRIAEIFRRGNRRSYVKVRDAARILKGKDITVAAHSCVELKTFLNTILDLCGGPPI